MLLAALSGAVAALGLAPFGLWPVSLIGFAVLTALVAGVGLRGALPHTPGYLDQKENAGVWDHPFLTAWAGGTGYFAVSLHWIVEPFLVDVATHGWMAPFALILMAGGLALFWGVAGWISARLGGPRALSWAVCLAVAEFVRGHVLTGFPWALPAYIWADTDMRLWAAFVGPYGLSFVTLALVGLAVMGPVRAGLAVVGIAVGLFGAPLVTPDDPGVTDRKVRLVQPNAPQHEKWDPEKAHIFVNRAIEFTGVPNEGVDLIIWPETAIPYPLDIAAPVLERVAAAADGVPVFAGLNRRTPDGFWFNSSVMIETGGVVSETYDKVHLVPFGEYIPLRIDVIRALAASSGYGFSSGERVRAIETPIGRTVPLICYEVIFPGHSRGVEGRQDLLLQITNDAWFGTFSGPYQHLDQARFRAVEQGLPMIRAANTGVSAVIDARGEVVASLALGEAGYLDVAVPAGLAPTFYARFGDWPAILVMIVALGGLFARRSRNTIANGPASS